MKFMVEPGEYMAITGSNSEDLGESNLMVVER